MASVLVDNWTLQRAAVNISDTHENIDVPNAEYIRLIEAIILWDNVYFIDNEFSKWWKDILQNFEYESFLAPFAVDQYEDYKELQSEHISNDVVQKSALKYNDFCNRNNIAYLPCQERAEYLKQCDFFTPYINRKDVMNFLDKSLTEYYSSLNSQFGTEKLKFSFPVLFDYVVANSKGTSYLKTALEMKEEIQVIRFRDWLSDFEQKLQEGSIDELQKLLNYLPELIKRLSNIMPSSYGAEIQISLAPSISIPINFDKSTRRLIHVSFLRTLSSYAVKKRKPNQLHNIVY